MFKHQVFQFLVIAAAIGVSRDVNGASLDDSKGTEEAPEKEKSQVTLQDLKEYIQPILYQKFLRTPGDSPVLTQAKTVVSEYLADSLIDSVKQAAYQANQAPPPADNSQRPALKQTTSTATATNTITSAGATLVQAVSGNRNRTRPSQQHVFNQVDSIIQNVNGANLTGIVDQALLIRAPAPVRTLVNGILSSVFCNPFNRLWNRCPGGGSLLFGPTQ